ncbi:hypothetical protein CVT26_005545 [Gymnopilus dilepis]|uniref:Uncharacterized protein n=1 Tax=Gymnopilus dilepis TaxID=231916 RepID=A0A409XZW6_9AGAR|nr:hypothetical protein CVT26_005545 [Gymnopilus dilepis]
MSQIQSLQKSPRVNASLLPRFHGQMIRLPCRVVQIKEEEGILLVEASDGGEVTILDNKNAIVKDPIIEVVGKVVGNTCVAMATCVNMGDNLGMFFLSELLRVALRDMKLVDDTIKLIHDPRFFGKMF